MIVTVVGPAGERCSTTSPATRPNCRKTHVVPSVG